MISPKKHLLDIQRSPAERYDRTQFLRLDKNEDICGLPEEILQDCLKKIHSDYLSAYPQVYPLYEKLSNYLSISEDHILITSGSDAAIKNSFEVYISPGDEVVIPDPTYAMYGVYAALFEAHLIKIPYDSNLKLPFEKVIAAINKKTKMIALANPNSPTGTIIDRNEIISLIRTAEKSDALVLIDEAYFPFYPHTVIDLVHEYSNLIVTRTFSKAFGLASARLGYAVADPHIIRNLKIFRPIYETNGLTVALGCAALEHPSFVETNVKSVIKGREYLENELKRLGFFVFESHSNFVNVRVGKSHVDPLVIFLKENGVLIKAGADHPALIECIRITAAPLDQMRFIIQCIEKYLKNANDNVLPE
jgi:histidinol-phosphate aminotransferase